MDLPQLVCPICGGYIPTPILATPGGVILCRCEPSGSIIESTAEVLPLEEEGDQDGKCC